MTIAGYESRFGLCSPELRLTAYQYRHEARYLDVEFERRGAKVLDTLIRDQDSQRFLRRYDLTAL